MTSYIISANVRDFSRKAKNQFFKLIFEKNKNNDPGEFYEISKSGLGIKIGHQQQKL